MPQPDDLSQRLTAVQQARHQAIRRGRVGQRLARRAAGRFTGKVLGRLFR